MKVGFVVSDVEDRVVLDSHIKQLGLGHGVLDDESVAQVGALPECVLLALEKRADQRALATRVHPVDIRGVGVVAKEAHLGLLAVLVSESVDAGDVSAGQLG